MLRVIKKIWQIAVILVTFCILAVGILLITEYSPKNGETLKVIGKGNKLLKKGDTVSITTYNIEHLTSKVRPDNVLEGKSYEKEEKQHILDNMEAVIKTVKDSKSDVVLLQDVDYKSNETYKINQYVEIGNQYEGASSIALTEDTYILYPIPNIIGRSKTGICIYSQYIGEAHRISLPHNYSFVERMMSAKKCIQKYVVPINNTDNSLVVFNLDFMDNNENIQIEQLQILVAEMKLEYDKGNFVISGGDFNMLLNEVENESLSKLNEELLPEDWKLVVSDKGTYKIAENEENIETVISDGFIVTPNVKVKSIKTIDTEFKYSNHNPVKLEIQI